MANTKILCYCNFTALFFIVFERNFQIQVPGAYIWRGDLTESFLRYEFGGLIFGGACFGNFTVPNVLHSGCKKYFRFFPLFLEFRDKLGESDKNRESRREKIPGGGVYFWNFCVADVPLGP